MSLFCFLQFLLFIWLKLWQDKNKMIRSLFFISLFIHITLARQPQVTQAPPAVPAQKWPTLSGNLRNLILSSWPWQQKLHSGKALWLLDTCRQSATSNRPRWILRSLPRRQSECNQVGNGHEFARFGNLVRSSDDKRWLRHVPDGY